MRYADWFHPTVTLQTPKHTHKHTRILRFAAQLLRLSADARGDAMCALYESMPFTPELMLRGYLDDLTPWWHHGHVAWDTFSQRGVVPIKDFHLSKKMRQYIRQRRFEITFDQDFAGVLAGCAEKELNGVENWVTPDIQAAYRTLREWGVAHSVEAWQDGKLVGGVLGVGIGSFFSSDTVFFRVSHASKVAFAHLLAALRKSGYTLHDVQSTGPFNQEFGSYEIPAGEYRTQLARAVVRPATLRPIPVEDIAPVAKPQARPIAV